MDKRAVTKGHLSAFITIFIWGTTFISTKLLLKDFSPVEIMFFRLVVAYAALILISPRFIPFKSWQEELVWMVAGLCGVTLFFLFQNIALSYTLASNASVLISVSPFFTAIFSRYFLKNEQFHAGFFIGFAVSIIGIALIAFNGNFVLKLNPLGDLLALLCAVVWAIYTILINRRSVQDTNTVQVTRRVFFYGVIFLIPGLFLFDFHPDLTRLADLPNLLNILFLGVGASALSFLTWNYAVRILGAVKTSIYIYVIPIITILMSAIVLREPVTGVAISGVALILLGLYLSERKPKM